MSTKKQVTRYRVSNRVRAVQDRAAGIYDGCVDVFITDFRKLDKPRGTAVAVIDLEFEIPVIPKPGSDRPAPVLLQVRGAQIHLEPQFKITLPRIPYPRGTSIGYAEVLFFEDPTQHLLFEDSILRALQVGYASEIPEELKAANMTSRQSEEEKKAA